MCTDCHGEHAVLSPSDRASPAYAANVSQQTCSRCHTDELRNRQYGLPLDRVLSYQESYHGLAARRQLRQLPWRPQHPARRDPRSTIAPANLTATCGQCHPGAGTRFAIGPGLPAAGRFYLILIPVVVGLMLLHNLADFRKKVWGRFAAEQQRPQLWRMTGNESWQHLLLLTSFENSRKLLKLE